MRITTNRVVVGQIHDILHIVCFIILTFLLYILYLLSN